MQPDRHPARGLPPRRRPHEALSEREPTGADRAREPIPRPDGWPPSPPPGWNSPPPPLAERARGFVHRYAFGAAVLTLAAVLLGLLYLSRDATDPASQDLSRLVQELQAASEGEEADSPPFAPTSEPTEPLQRPEATLSVISDPEGAVVLLDSDTVGVTPLRGHPVESGIYFLSVREAQHEPRDTILYFGEGQAVDVLFSLSPSRPGGAAVHAPAEVAQTSASELSGYEAPEVTLEEETSEADMLELEEDEEEAPPEPGQLLITSEPAQAEVWLDGQRVGATPLLHRDVQPGSYTVTLRRDGYAPFTMPVELRPGQRIVSISGRLEERFGTLTLLVRPWGTIYIDGQLHRRDTDAAYEIRLPTGPHEVKVVHPTLGVWEDTVNVEPGAARRMEIRLPASAGSE